jgi:hypothetical protein
MPVMDEVLVGDATIGNYVVGFFDSRANDGETAESKILRAYKNMFYKNVRPYRRCGCLEGVIHEGLDQEAIKARSPEQEHQCQQAFDHLYETIGHDSDRQVESIKKYRTENFTG